MVRRVASLPPAPTSNATLSKRNIAVAAKGKSNPKLKNTGYIETDNSGRGNIFPTAQKTYYKSPTSSAVASQGLGGLQGAGVLAAAVAVVAAVTAVTGNVHVETLSEVAASYTGDSLSAIAGRISSTL